MGSSLLLAVHCKKSDPANLKDAIMLYVRNAYGSRAAEDCSDDLAEVETLRGQVINQAKAIPGLKDTLMKYYSLICAVESRFPISNSADHANITFTWYDAFHPQKKCDQSNIHFEKAAIAFNIAAAISQYALECDRRTEAGLTNAARLFQEAAGAFAHLRDAVALKVDAPRPIDLSPECAAMLERLMLAQAQECVLDKAIAGGKQPATLARLAKQVAVFYDDTSRLLCSKPLSDHFDRSWQAHAAAKSLLFHLEADLQNAAHLRNEDFLRGVASEIAQLRAAKGPLESAKKEAKAASKELQDNVAEKERIVSERLTKAEKENAMVYLQRVPAAAELPVVVPASLVKSILPANMGPSAATDKMFKGVVPETTTKALSKYTDMVDSLIRKQTDALDAASDDARIKLREWELPESLSALEPTGSVAALPEAVKVDLEKVTSAGGVPSLRELSAQITNLRNVTEAELNAAEADLAAEGREDDELRTHYGARWTRAPSAQLTAPMLDKIKGYRGNLKAAGEADARLDAKIAAESAAFGALEPTIAAGSLPRLQSPMLSVDNMDPASAVAALRAGLDGLATLSSQRAALEQALKERKAGDDILPKLLGGGGASNVDALFKAELAKYDDLVKGVEENIAKQKQLLLAIAAANATFRDTYNFADWNKQCDTAAQGIRATARSFLEISSNLTEGVRFYTSLQDAVAALRQQIGDYVMTRKVQRDDLLEQLKNAAAAQEAAAAQQLAGMNLQQQQQPPHGYGAYPQPPPPPQPPAVPHWPPAYAQAPPPPQQSYPAAPGYPAMPQQPQQPYYGMPAQQGSGPQVQQQQQQPQQPPPPPPPSSNPIGNFFGFGRH